MVDAVDSKSTEGNFVGVQVPSSVLWSNFMKFFLSLLLSLFLLSCASKVNLPSWVVSPISSNHSICGVGSANLKNVSSQAELERVARMMAMADLSKSQSLKVESELASKKNSNASSISTSSLQSSNMAMTYNNNPVEVESFMDNSTGTYYLLLCLE